jgi:hypothetical protein
MVRNGHALRVKPLHSLPVDSRRVLFLGAHGEGAEGALSARRKRPIILDPDEFDHLPEIAYIPVEGVDTAAKRATIRLREMARGGTALLLYSSRKRLVAAHGHDHPVMAVSSRELPALQRRLGFHAVLLDVGLPPELRRQDHQSATGEPDPVPMEVDRATGEPLVYVPSRPYRTGDDQARLELQPLAKGQLALLAYSSRQSLLDGCGPEQHYVRLRAAMLPEAMRQCGADQVLIDAPLPDHLRH